MKHEGGEFAASSGLRVRVRSERCQGHARCVAHAPELFELDELGYSHEIGAGVVALGLEGKARLAKANCPEFAIEIIEEGASR
ncbi:MAG TPA: ferredoxin [Aliidongia sp.]|nr:ferredoxin [Aliidongia sp.]